MSYDNGESKVYPTKLGPLDKLAIKELYGSSKTDGKHVAAWSWNKRTETLTQIGKEHADKIHGTGVKDAIQGRGGNDRLFGFDGDDTLNGAREMIPCMAVLAMTCSSSIHPSIPWQM
jgi:hypothetical protein